MLLGRHDESASGVSGRETEFVRGNQECHKFSDYIIRPAALDGVFQDHIKWQLDGEGEQTCQQKRNPKYRFNHRKDDAYKEIINTVAAMGHPPAHSSKLR